MDSADKLTPKQLEKRFGAEAARWASLQSDLRKKALAKFADGGQMLFDREALEQATHEAIAVYHASRFPAGEIVVDMTVGIGADLIALAARGPVIGFELDHCPTPKCTMSDAQGAMKTVDEETGFCTLCRRRLKLIR